MGWIVAERPHGSSQPDQTAGSHPTDVRMTTRFKDNDLTEGLTGAIHETGHALYEQGRNLEYDGLPVNQVSPTVWSTQPSGACAMVCSSIRWAALYEALHRRADHQLGARVCSPAGSSVSRTQGLNKVWARAPACFGPCPGAVHGRAREPVAAVGAHGRPGPALLALPGAQAGICLPPAATPPGGRSLLCTLHFVFGQGDPVMAICGESCVAPEAVLRDCWMGPTEAD